MPSHLGRLPHLRFWLGVLGAEGVGDALVGGVGLPSMQRAYIVSRTATP
jgi:hypothetical protein